VIKPLEAEDKTAGGILLPDTAKEKSTRARCWRSQRPAPAHGRIVKVAVEVGDIVLYSKYGGSDVKVDGKELKIIQEGEILAIVG